MSLIKELFPFLKSQYVVVKINSDDDSVKYVYKNDGQFIIFTESIGSADRYSWISASKLVAKLSKKNTDKAVEFCVINENDIHNINGLLEFMKGFA